MLFHVYAEPKPDGYFDPKTEPFGICRQIVDADWLPGGDELTPTMKLKRKPIQQKYASEIEELYR